RSPWTAQVIGLTRRRFIARPPCRGPVSVAPGACLRIEGARDRVEAVDTGAALPGAGGGQIPHRPRCLADAARAPRQDDDRSGAEPRAPWPQVGLKQGRIGGLALAEPAAEETAYEEGADVLWPRALRHP